VAFIKQARKKMAHFSLELAEGSEIDQLDVEQKELAWMPTTNDRNESNLAQMRTILTRAPNKTLDTLNAEMMIRHNDPDSFIAARLTPEDQKKLLAGARKVSASGSDKARKNMLVEAAIEKEELNRAK
jgi:hypothetical protein